MKRPLIQLGKNLLSILVLSTIFFFLLNAPAFIVRSRPLQANQAFLPKVTDANPTIGEGLHITRLDIEVPVHFDVEAANEPVLLTSLQTGVSHLLGTARPGERGNAVIVGHSSNFPWDPGKYKTIFAPLDRLETGDHIQLRRGSTIYVYQVVGERVVKPSDLSVLSQTKEPSLTLITCTPVGTTLRRLVVTATQISPDPSAAQSFTGAPLISSLPSPR